MPELNISTRDTCSKRERRRPTDDSAARQVGWIEAGWRAAYLQSEQLHKLGMGSAVGVLRPLLKQPGQHVVVHLRAHPSMPISHPPCTSMNPAIQQHPELHVEAGQVRNPSLYGL